MKQKGFTLIEICLAVAIALVMLMIAVPSISGVISKQKADGPFEAFNGMVKQAQSRSLSEGRPYFIAWEEGKTRGQGEIVLRPVVANNEGEVDGVARIPFSEKESYDLAFPAAMMKKTPKQWAFWATGTCEPATIIYKGPDASWTATYNPLTVKAEVTEL
jgi:prepilin-type N-terminal cleavage/methylation domain-containing protein